ncbi:RIP metalloprotease RseP [Candidatus Uhrbacteria bacterium]|nr:RIP metalloprotease RseP [Candidatus Uhrbacteria bacterium]
MGTILLFIIVLSLLVFVHELGHFLVAKKTGMKVEEFGFGFPPKLFGIKKGDTVYSINWIPLGGFVRIKGESGDHKEDSDSFASKKIWQRFSVLIAGVAMNLVLAAIFLSIGFMVGLPSIVDENLPKSARVEESKLTIMTVLEKSPAKEAGVNEGDNIVSIDGRVFDLAQDARDHISEKGLSGIELVTQSKDESYKTFVLTSEPLEGTEIIGIGLGFELTGFVSYPFFQSIWQGILTTGELTFAIVAAFIGIIANLISGQGVGVDLSGPVGIAVLTGQVAALGLIHLLQFTALLSINLAVINVLPFPALDGGRLLFLVIEKFRGKNVNVKIETAVHNFGFLLLMVLVVLVTYKDFVNFGDEILGAIKSFI